MRALAELDFEALRDYSRDLLHERGAAAAHVSQLRQELPYHPLLDGYEAGSEELRDRLERVSSMLLEETTREPWPLENLHFLLSFVEEARIRSVTERLKSIVHSNAWLAQPEGRRRHMLGLRTLLGLDWWGDPRFWLRQHQRLEAEYPLLIFRGLAIHDPKLAFGQLGNLVTNSDQGDQILQLLPSLIEENSLARVRDWVREALEEVPVEIAQQFHGWFEERRYGSVVADDAARDSGDRPAADVAPKGWPVTGKLHRAYVVDGEFRRVPFESSVSPGVGMGELVFAGDWLADCYYLPERSRTALRFRPDPWSREPGSRLYMTGHRVWVQADGRLSFMDDSKFQQKRSAPARKQTPAQAPARRSRPLHAKSR